MKQLHEQTSPNRRRDEEGIRNPTLFNTINNQRNSLSRYVLDDFIQGFDRVYMHHDRWMIIPWAYQHHESMIGPAWIVRTYQVTPTGIIWTHPVNRLGLFGSAQIVWTHPGCWWVI
ncbi:hypothetical protein AMTRI_Chr10g231050 [Amborella trichopoda]